MFRVIPLFVFVFGRIGRIVHRTICIQLNSLKPLFGTSLLYIYTSVVDISKISTYLLNKLHNKNTDTSLKYLHIL